MPIPLVHNTFIEPDRHKGHASFMETGAQTATPSQSLTGWGATPSLSLCACIRMQNFNKGMFLIWQNDCLKASNLSDVLCTGSSWRWLCLAKNCSATRSHWSVHRKTWNSTRSWVTCPQRRRTCSVASLTESSRGVTEHAAPDVHQLTATVCSVYFASVAFSSRTSRGSWGGGQKRKNHLYSMMDFVLRNMKLQSLTNDGIFCNY